LSPFAAISPQAWIVHPISLGSKYAISLSVQQLVGVLMILVITFLNTRGVRLGKVIQNIFTSAKTLALVGLIFLGIFVGRNAGAMSENFSHLWAIHNPQTLEPGANFLKSFVPTLTAASGVLDCSLLMVLRRLDLCFPPMPGTISGSPPRK